MGPPLFQSPKAIAGYVIGWISGLMYCTSRIPQIIKNVCQRNIGARCDDPTLPSTHGQRVRFQFRRKSTDGLALSMFAMAILGNITYALGILLYVREHTSRSVTMLLWAVCLILLFVAECGPRFYH